MYCQMISTRTLLGYLKKKNSNNNLSMQVNIKSQTRNKNRHENASPTSSTPSTPDYVSLGEDSETCIYQNRLIGQKAAKDLNVDKEKRKLER